MAELPSVVPTLTTPRLVLRPWQLEDASVLFDILQQADILKYFPRTTPPPIDRVEKYIAHHHAHWQERGYGHWAVVENETKLVIGWCGLEFLPETAETEVAYLLSTPFWGKGFATEAARASLAYGFDVVRLQQVIGLVHPENIASRRVLEKNGLAYTHRAVYFGMELDRFAIEKVPGSPHPSFL
jgi:RimJ/RimL family protein N-acetyltransferase